MNRLTIILITAVCVSSCSGTGSEKSDGNDLTNENVGGVSVEQAIANAEFEKEQKRISDSLKVEEEKLRVHAEEAKKERIDKAMLKLRSKTDDMTDVTWCYSKSTVQYRDKNSFHLYMGKKGNGSPWLRLRIQYKGDNWLFIEKYIIKTDDNTYTINTSYGDVKRDNGYGGIWEWYDVEVDSKIRGIVEDVATSNTVKIRHEGRQYYKDRTITQTEIKALDDILEAYNALGGK